MYTYIYTYIYIYVYIGGRARRTAVALVFGRVTALGSIRQLCYAMAKR